MYAFLFGLLFGSFANVIVYRVPKGLSIIMPPSACPQCNTRLKPPDLIPVFSWVFLMGRCRYCKASISLRYPITEFVMGITFSVIAWWTQSWLMIPFAFISFILLCLFIICIDKISNKKV